MIPTAALSRSITWTGAVALVAFALFAGSVGAWPALAQSTGTAPAAAQAKGTIEKLSGVWVEGPGFNITYGKTYEVCAQLCLDTQTCVMIEYYRPEKKCNLYDTLRPRKPGGSSHVGIRR